jgi:serine/threonine protein phosphatase PrpC
LKSGTVAICGSIQGWREYMEDFYTIQKVNEDTLIAGVFDGHGGP